MGSAHERRAAHSSGHVLHLTDCYHAGVGRAINDIVANSPHLAHSLAFHGEEEPPPGVFAETFRVGGSTWSRMRQFRRIVRQSRASIVHAHSSWAGGFARVGWRSAVPIVYQPHCYKFVDPTLPRPLARLFRLLERVLLWNTTVTVVVSPAEQEAARSVGATRLVPVRNVPSLPPGQVNTEGMSRRRVTMLGRLVPQKDPEFFLEVVRQCRRACPDIEAVWIGDGPEEARVLLTGQGVHITGWLNQEDVGEWLSQGGVYAHTARYEAGVPLAVLEAAQRGVAVVARRIDALWRMDELPQFDSASEMASEVVRLLRDPGIYRESVANGRNLLRNHTNERQAQALRALYDSVLAAA